MTVAVRAAVAMIGRVKVHGATARPAPSPMRVARRRSHPSRLPDVPRERRPKRTAGGSLAELVLRGNLHDCAYRSRLEYISNGASTPSQGVCGQRPAGMDVEPDTPPTCRGVAFGVYWCDWELAEGEVSSLRPKPQCGHLPEKGFTYYGDSTRGPSYRRYQWE